MKTVLRNIILLSSVTAVFGLTSCNDFLTLYPTDKITEEEFWEDKNDLESGLGACYYQMASSDVVNRIIQWGEYRATDNLTLSDMSNTEVNDIQSGILRPTSSYNDWAAFYKLINYCNKVIEHGQAMYEDQRDISLTAAVWGQYKSEAVTLRAMAYFYLVRAFRNVPFVEQSIGSDREAMNSALPQTDGVYILSKLIDELEEVKATPNRNLGNNVSNHGRITEKAIYALIADMRLWRGCMLKQASAKRSSGYLTNTTYNNIDLVAKADSISSADFSTAANYAQKVIDLMNEDYNDNHKNPITGTIDRQSEYPLLQYTGASTGSFSDEVYGEIFGSGNAEENIFELQYDATNQSNASLWLFVKSTDLTATNIMKVSSGLYANLGSLNPTTGFGKTDARAIQTSRIEENVAQTYVLTKGAASSIMGEDSKDMTRGATYSLRSNASNNFIIYRLSDVMLIEAEALMRKASPTETERRKALDLVVELFKRNNPGASKVSSETDTYISWMVDNYVNNLAAADVPSASNLLSTIYAERQREFVGEGKRWFDLVRMAEANNSTTASLELMGATRQVSAQLSEMMSFYYPVYSEEIKANEQLVQNPIWVNNN